MGDLWHNFSALWAWALEADDKGPLVIAVVITAGLAGVLGGAAYYAGVGVRQLVWAGQDRGWSVGHWLSRGRRRHHDAGRVWPPPTADGDDGGQH